MALGGYCLSSYALSAFLIQSWYNVTSAWKKIVFSKPCLMTAENLDLCQDIGLRTTSDTAARTLWVLLIDSRNESCAVFNTLQCEIKGNWSSAHFLCRFLEIS